MSQQPRNHSSSLSLSVHATLELFSPRCFIVNNQDKDHDQEQKNIERWPANIIKDISNWKDGNTNKIFVQKIRSIENKQITGKNVLFAREKAPTNQPTLRKVLFRILLAIKALKINQPKSRNATNRGKNVTDWKQRKECHYVTLRTDMSTTRNKPHT